MATLTYSAALILLAAAFHLMYGSTKVPNFALGTICGFGAYAAYTCKEVFNLPVYLGAPISFLTGALLALIMSLMVIEPLIKRGRTLVEMTLATLGLRVLFEAFNGIYDYYLQTLLHRRYTAIMLHQYDFRVGAIYGVFLVSTLLAFSSFFLLRYLFSKTRFGLSAKAVWENSELAQIQGINPRHDRVLLWALAGGFAGLSGGIMVMWFHITPLTGSWIMTAVFASVILGGVDSLRGAFIGGLLTGFVEIQVTSWGQAVIGVWMGEYRSVFPMIIIVFVLSLYPNGLFGEEINDKHAPLRFLKRLNWKQWLTIILAVALSGVLFSHTCTVNRVKAREEFLQGFSGYDLEVMEMNRTLPDFNAGALTSFKDMTTRLNITKIYITPYNDKTTSFIIYFQRNNIIWKTTVNLRRYGLCQYVAR